MLARHAEVRNGLLNLLGGGWDTLTVAYPAEGPGVATMTGSIAIRLLLDPAETGRSHDVRVVIAGDDGATLGDIGGEIEVPHNADAPAGWEQNVSIAMHVSGLVLPALGGYTVRLEVGGAVLGERRFRVEPRS